MSVQSIKAWFRWIVVWLIVLSVLTAYQIMQSEAHKKATDILLKSDSIKLYKLNDIQRSVKDSAAEKLLETVKNFDSVK